MEERKFVCKYCFKRYPCGKSLGGHIRTHMTEHSAAQDNEGKRNAGKVKFDDVRKRKKRDLGSEEAGGNSIYGLRENPRKTTRFVHSNSTLHQEMFCRECGKGFPSLKALCGHMACHSEKEKGTNKFENNSGLSEKKKSVMDSQSDTETSSAPTLPRGSKRMRFMTLNNYGSSSVSEVEQEQEEVARCLMLLSQDSSHRGRFALVTESSDNNSVVLEAKSPSGDTRITINNGKNSVSNASELVKKKKVEKDMKLKSAEIDDSDNSDSGYFRYGPRKLDSDVSIDGFLKNDYFNQLKLEDYNAESRKMLHNRCRSRNTESKKPVMEDLDYARKFDSRKKANNDYLSRNLDGVSCKKMKNGFPNDEVYKNGRKGWKFECLTSERTNGCSYDSAYDQSDENSTDTESYPAQKPQTSKAKKKLKSKKSSKDHECPICYRIFRSGQALGGHKRSHFVASLEENTVAIKQDSPAVPCLIDLNLPAPVDE